MNLKNRKKIFITLTLFAIFLSILIFPLITNKTNPPSPEVGLLKIDNHILIIYPSKKYLTYQEENHQNQQLLYCLNTEENPTTCNWQESAIFQIEYNRNYYAYIKSPSTNFISAPEPVNYSIPDYPDDIDLYQE